MPESRGVRVEAVAKGSPAAAAGIRPGDRVLAVSGKAVGDLLDFHFLTSRSRFVIRWAGRDGAETERAFRPAAAPLGIFPEPIRVRRCRNRCIFCFVHQLPRGLRRSLYVKDEDVRLSFLHGQYVTFSDVTEDELRRIVRYRLSPLYVSIHATDPKVRGEMLGRKGPCDVIPVMRRLVAAGIALHGQIVVCPGVNDGAVLERSLEELSALRPGLGTVAVVPVGLTGHREGLPPLRPVTREQAVDTLAMVERLGRRLWRGGGEPFATAADEYYLIAGKPIPGKRRYGSFAQIGNGVGLLRLFMDEASSLFRGGRWPTAGDAGGAVVSGVSPRSYVAKFLREFSRRAGAEFAHLPVENGLMGNSVTVTGLLGGRDIIAAVARAGAKRVYVPSVCLRDAGDLFLDNVTPDDLSRETGARVVLFDPTPRGFRRAVYMELTLD